jgi:putative tryptophan/tyrosine transport system substrate-binding protein
MSLPWRQLRDALTASRSRPLQAGVLVAVMAALQLPSTTWAQSPAAPFRIAVLTAAWGPPNGLSGLVGSLNDLGYRENEDFVVGVRFTSGDVSTLGETAREIVAGGVDVIVAVGELGALAAKQATSSHPIVFMDVADPVGLGLIDSYARPGGNLTGVTDLNLEVSGRRLQLFQEVVPRLQRVLYTYSLNDKIQFRQTELYRLAAPKLGIMLVERPVSTVDEAAAVFAGLRHEDVEGLLAPSSVELNIPGLIVEATRSRAIPSMFDLPVYVNEGGFASYGGAFDADGRQVGRLIDKIIRGADPAEIPVESAHQLELTINLQVARDIGLDIPPEALFQASSILR